MSSRKKTLLKQYRRKKNIVLFVLMLSLVAIGFFAGIRWALPFLIVIWFVREAWFSDHLFYAPDVDYAYRFDEQLETLPTDFSDGYLRLASDIALDTQDTLILAVTVRAGCLGRLRDPAISIDAEGEPESGGDCQTFERGAKGVRYLNLTGFAEALQQRGLRLRGRHCRLEDTPRPQLYRAAHPDYRQKRVLVIAPHADDAEIAAFGLYSQAKEAWIVTLTAGEIETAHYRRMGLERAEAARLKGRLRAWDSHAVPLWAGVPAGRIIQLGYFCKQLSAMRQRPDEALASQEADLCDTRFFRTLNSVREVHLTSDRDGIPSWNNLLGDLREIIQQVKPEVIVLPHALLDSHPDHIAANEAVRESLANSEWHPEVLLHYAIHLHDTDRWPMGETHRGVALPPLIENMGPLVPWSFTLDRSRQIDKAMALGMMHDLVMPLPFKKHVRRALQRFLAGRQYSPYGVDDFFRKAVRRHELFWVEFPVTEKNQNSFSRVE